MEGWGAGSTCIRTPTFQAFGMKGNIIASTYMLKMSHLKTIAIHCRCDAVNWVRLYKSALAEWQCISYLLPQLLI